MKSSLSTLISKIIRRLRLYKNRAALLRRKFVHRPKIFEEGYCLDDTTQVTLFTDHDDLFPGYQPRVNLTQAQQLLQRSNDCSFVVKVSLIATIKNEQSNVEAWGESLLNQTRLPDEIVITDAGSTDGTLELLRKLSSRSPIPFHIISEPGANISKGRNIAIANARHNVIATTDFGCRLRVDWLEKLIAPFEIDPNTQVVAGMFHIIDREGRMAVRNPWWSSQAKIDPKLFLPSGRSAAFTKDAWKFVGGYPEWLTLTGEDTYFDLELKRTCHWWAFSPDAVVDWEAPESIWMYWKKMYRWSIGDGETGMRGTAYWYATIVSALTLFSVLFGLLFLLLGTVFRLPILLFAGAIALIAVLVRAANSGRKAGYTAPEVILVIGILAAQAAGFLRGAFRRTEVARRRVKTASGLYFILAVIPIDDTGGGARSTQIALELLRRQKIVVYINKYPKDESVELNLQIRHPNLFTIPADAFCLQDFCAQYDMNLSKYEVGVVVEMPHTTWLPIIDDLRAQGAKVIYELIDEWDSNLGAGWYSEAVELSTIQKADALTATAPVLKNRLEETTQRPVCLLPNAVNLRLFNQRKNFPIPADLPHSEFVITYIGALYGNWFDWELLADIARTYPMAKVVVIGDYRGQSPVELPNLHFLGLKAQSSLPAYLAHTKVAIIPWKVNDITLATSPLKLYEYLAMHVPVVVPDLPLLRNIPAVYGSKDREAFLRNIEAAGAARFDTHAVDEFVLQNSWETRVNQLIQLMNFERSRQE